MCAHSSYAVQRYCCLLVNSLPVAQSILSSKFEEKMDYAQTLWAHVLGLGLSLDIHYKLKMCVSGPKVCMGIARHMLDNFSFGQKNVEKSHSFLKLENSLFKKKIRLKSDRKLFFGDLCLLATVLRVP